MFKAHRKAALAMKDEGTRFKCSNERRQAETEAAPQDKYGLSLFHESCADRVYYSDVLTKGGTYGHLDLFHCS